MQHKNKPLIDLTKQDEPSLHEQIDEMQGQINELTEVIADLENAMQYLIKKLGLI